MVVISDAWLNRAPKGIGPLVHNEGNHQLKSAKFADNRPIFTIEISYPNNLFFAKSICRLQCHFNFFLDLTKGTMALILWQDVPTDCVKPKTNITPFEVTTQGKISH